MRATVLTLIAALTLTSCAAEREVPTETLVERRGHAYEVNSDDPFTGVAVSHHENGQLRAKVALKDGRLDGPLQIYYENGQLLANVAFMSFDEGELPLITWEEIIEPINTSATNEQLGLYDYNNRTYVYGHALETSGPFDGPVEAYHENGQLLIKVSYKAGRLDGPYERYYENGQLRKKGSFKAGQSDGPYEGYYENGQLREKGSYKAGQSDGPFETYHENGQLRQKGICKDGRLDSPYEGYDENGQLLDSDQFIEKYGIILPC